ncbi:MAG: preprotein translocase subunit SecA [Planctomycetota bacterium]
MFEKASNKFFKVLTGIFGSRNERILKSLWPMMHQINALEPDVARLSDSQLKDKTAELKKRLSEGASLDDLLPEAFAVVREAGKRTVKMRPFDVQLIGGIVLHQGRISEMATGEGKTLVATLPAYLNALTGKGVHIVTVNDYLARRDREWMGPVYELLGLTVGAIQNDMNNADRKIQYACDITYGTNNEFGFDYLRDNMKIRFEDQAQRGHYYAIVDEVDSILIDEARTPLIISGPAEESTEKYYKAEQVAGRLKKESDYTIKEKEHTVVLTEAGLERAHEFVGIPSFYDLPEHMDWPHHIEQALRAKELYKLDREYVIKDGEIIIVDEFTGRLMPGRRWSDGLHQAIESKEHLKIRQENQTLATITLQNYFKLYRKLAGMTGTAVTEAMEFDKIYGLEVAVIPPNRSLVRNTYPDMVFRTEQEKFEAIIEEIVRIHETGRPVLVGTTSIANSERLSDLLRRRGVKHEVLNAKQHEREAQIVAQAGQPAAVTIATNMAGRGTDILLGDGVAKLGGLHILGTERHEARRIDNQLRGRSGRQGDPGSSQFVLSLEDNLLRLFAPDWVRNILYKLGMTEGQAIESRMISNAIEKAQKRMEAHNFDIRKHLLEYDQVMNEQRKIIYGQRQQVLKGEKLKEMVTEMIEERVFNTVDTFLPKGAGQKEWNYAGLAEFVQRKFALNFAEAEIKDKPVSEIETIILNKVKAQYEERENRLTPDYMRKLERYILLDKIDETWKEHLYAMDHLKSGVGLRGYAQVDPKIEYKREGYRLFDRLIESIKDEVTGLIFKVKFDEATEAQLKDIWQPTEFSHQEIGSFEGMERRDAAAGSSRSPGRAGGPAQPAIEKSKPVKSVSKVGRNDPCPCGSGKKYKKCCGVGG